MFVHFIRPVLVSEAATGFTINPEGVPGASKLILIFIYKLKLK